MQHLQKTGGWGARLAHPTRMRILRPPTAEEPKDSSPASLFCTPVHQECFTIPLQPSSSALFLKIAGVSPYNSHSGNLSTLQIPDHFSIQHMPTRNFRIPISSSPTILRDTGTAPELSIPRRNS